MGTLNRPKSHWCMSSRDLRWGKSTARRRRTCAWLKREARKLNRRRAKEELRYGFMQEEPTLDEYFGVNPRIRDIDAKRADRRSSYHSYWNKQLWEQLRKPLPHCVTRFDDSLDSEMHYYEDELEGYEMYKRDLEYERELASRPYYGRSIFDIGYEDDGWDDYDPYDDYYDDRLDRVGYVFKDMFGRWQDRNLSPDELKTDKYLAMDLFLNGKIKTPDEDFSECELRYEDHWGGDDWDDCATLARLNIQDAEDQKVVDLKEFWRRNGFAV